VSQQHDNRLHRHDGTRANMERRSATMAWMHPPELFTLFRVVSTSRAREMWLFCRGLSSALHLGPLACLEFCCS
jgi:hypothetical protein